METASNRAERAPRQRRLTWIAIVFILLMGMTGAFAVLQPTMATVDPVVENIEKGLPVEAAVLNADSDGDGLKNWEEALYKTAIAEMDTDRDGTADGAEISQNRDPLKPGPDDALPAPIFDVQTASAEDVSKNLTYQLAKNIFSGVTPEFLAAADGGEMSPTDLSGFASVLRSIDTTGTIPTSVLVTARDVTVSNDTSPRAIAEYFNAVWSVYDETFASLQEDDFEIVQRAIEQKNFAELENLAKVSGAFDESFRRVKGISVPRGYEDFAVRELNYITRSSDLIKAFRTSIETDPLRAAILIQARADLMKEIQVSHQETRARLQASGIVFNESNGMFQASL